MKLEMRRKLARESFEEKIRKVGQLVRLVARDGGGVSVETSDETFRADRVLVTVPGPLVSELAFEPVLPDHCPHSVGIECRHLPRRGE